MNLKTFATILFTRRRDQAMIALLSGVVMVLIICHMPKAIINIYECYQVYIFDDCFCILSLLSLVSSLYLLLIYIDSFL